jgi:Tol biopolymer transport system component
VAVKVLPEAVANDLDRRARFEREARAVAALSHPNILAIFDFATADGRVYAVTELLDGETLRARLGSPLTVRNAVDMATQIARGLAAAHDKGIVHRDLKPENVFVLNDGQVKILDFGLAKAITDGRREDADTVAGTDPGTVLGTVGYMAPEQIRGQDVDGRADLFALGAVLYEMLAGRRAFQRDTPAETMTAILKEDPPHLTMSRGDLPPALDAVVGHCLERNPAERFQSARDLVFNLQAASAATGSGPASTMSAVRSRAKITGREAIAWTLAASLAVVVMSGLALWRGRSPSGPAPVVARFSVAPPDKTGWASTLGAPDGTNSGTISPDGKTLVFVAADATGKVLVWVRPLDSLTATALPGTDGAAFPFWSSDSRFLAFFTQTRLRRMPAGGGPVQTVAELSSTPRGGTWNAQGVILFATAGSAIMRVSADGGQPAPVTTPDAQNPGHQWPSFLPDGEHFFYYGSGTGETYLGSLASGTLKKVARSDTNAIFAPPEHVLFVREGSLFGQRFDLTRLETVGEPVPIVQDVSWNVSPWNLGAFSVSDNGRLTYRLGGGSRTQFAWFDRSGRQIAVVGPPGDYLSLALSPDETKVAFTRRDDQTAGDIWTLDLARQTLSRFTFDASSEIYPVWSSDGQTIAYESTRDGLFAKNADGTGATRHLLGTPSSLIPTQILSDRKLLLFFADFGGATGFDTYVLTMAEGAKPTPVIQTVITDVEPQLSPDARWIAYASTETGAYDVFVQPFPTTGAKWQISAGGGRQPMWRRDGRELFFVTNDRKFYAVNVDLDWRATAQR